MKSKAALSGHPIHPMLIPFPFAFLTGAILFDLAGRFTETPAWWTTGGHLVGVGIITALLAALPGLVDFFYTVPPNSSGKTRATKHMIANLTAVALFAAAWWVRQDAAARPDGIVLGLELIGFVSLSVGGYLGGTLAYRNQIGVDHRYVDAGRWREARVAARRGQPAKVADRDELQVDQMKLLHVNGKRIVLARTARGYVAFDDRCTHKGGSLAGGVMIGGIVQCPWHGSQFDCDSGAVKGGPAKKDIGVHTVKEEKGEVLLVL